MQQSTASPVSCFPYVHMITQRYPFDNGCNLSSWSTCPVKSSTIYLFLFFFNFPLLKLRISWLSQPSLITECGHQLVHKIAWYLSQSVGFKNKQQFLTTKAVIKQASFHKSRTRKMHQKCCLFVLHSQSYLNNALLKKSITATMCCVFQQETPDRVERIGRVKCDYRLSRTQKIPTDNLWCLNWVSNWQNNYSKHMSINASLKMSPTTQNPSCHRVLF